MARDREHGVCVALQLLNYVSSLEVPHVYTTILRATNDVLSVRYGESREYAILAVRVPVVRLQKLSRRVVPQPLQQIPWANISWAVEAENKLRHPFTMSKQKTDADQTSNQMMCRKGEPVQFQSCQTNPKENGNSLQKYAFKFCQICEGDLGTPCFQGNLENGSMSD